MPAGDSVISATADRILCAAAVLLAVLMVILDMTVINVSLPYMMGTLGATPDEFPYGDFENVHRCGVLSAESRAIQTLRH